MKKRIALWVLAIAATGVAALWLLRPELTRIVLLIDWSLIASNRHPPPIVAGLISDDDLRDQDRASRKFTALLQQKLPVGTDESTLKLQLAREGFKPLSESYLNKTECQPPIQIEPFGTISVTCTYTYPEKILQYRWGGPICSSSLFAMWSTDDGGKITRIEGQYYGACL